RFDASLDLVVGLVVDDGIDQVVPFVLVWGATIGGLPSLILRCLVQTFVDARRRAAVAAFGGDGAALGSVNEAVIDGGGTLDAPAIEQQLSAVGEGVFDPIGIEILVDERLAIVVVAIVAAAHGLRLDRPAVFHP